MSEQTTPDKTIDISRHFFVARAGFAAPFFSWLGIFIVVMLFYTLTAAAPMLGDIVWQDAASFATGLWSTAFGGSISIAGAKFSLVATTITVAVYYASYVALRQRLVSTWGEVIAVGVGQAILVALICLVGQSTTDLWRAALGSAILGMLTALWAGRERLLVIHRWVDYVKAATPRLRAIVFSMLALSTVFFILALVFGWTSIRAIYGYYVTSVTGVVGLTLLQILYLPTFIFWAFSWMIGAGFAIGTGTNFSAFGVDSAPLPALPILGALPSPSLHAWWAVLLVVLLSVGIALVVHRRQGSRVPLRSVITKSVVAVGIVALGAGVLAVATSGAIGPGRMVHVGATPHFVMMWFAVFVALPFLLTSFFAHSATQARIGKFVVALKTKKAAWKEAARERAAKRDDEAAREKVAHRDDEEVAMEASSRDPREPVAHESTEIERPEADTGTDVERETDATNS